MGDNNKYNMDMSEEKAPRILFSIGDHNFEVMNIREETSKAGNTMFVTDFQEVETGYPDTVYMVAEKGKRWMLKNFLSACGVEPAKDATQNYVWCIDDVIGKIVIGEVQHEPNEYINRAGETVKTIQSRIVRFKKNEQEKWPEEDEPEATEVAPT